MKATKKNVIQAIDEVMNNREIDSIRNAILAIRDKVLEMDEDDGWQKEYCAILRLRGEGNQLCESMPFYPGCKYVKIDCLEKVDAGLYGTIEYLTESEAKQYKEWGY